MTILNVGALMFICFQGEEFSGGMNKIAGSDHGVPRRLQQLRERHLVLCETVEVLDRSFCVILAFIYGVSIGLCCVLLYDLINIHMDLSVAFVICFWLACVTTMMGVTTYFVAQVNEAMHAVAYDIQTVQTDGITSQDHTQLQLFLAKLNGPSMGFTVLGMVTVTKEFMLTIFSLILTYAVILLQFQ
ncbi:uncharacterized protein LOC101849397 isoform X2 [Aplysia californica]|uniref:Uncharacterized protein LOC101849397 isoform X2 n=1 Tax=Aplysia californica TaxID=6500 RepID=A0ABM1VZ21_APLCA|nr:uncharacterized protein LOC101849397 isoform X2 [Aplysia californica]